MGSSTSRATKPRSLVRKSQDENRDPKPEGKGKKSAAEADGIRESKDKRPGNNNPGNVVNERRDSKQFWISHLKFRRKSGSDLGRDLIRGASNSVEKSSDVKHNKQTRENCKSLPRKPISLEPSAEAKREDKVVSLAVGGISSDVGSKIPHIVENSKDLSSHSSVSKETEKYQAISVDELYNYLNDGALAPCICDPSYILLLDTRDKELYEKSHILLGRRSNSLYTDLQSYHLHGFSTGTNIANVLNEFTLAIVYGNQITGADVDGTPEVKLIRELEGHGVEPYLLKAGFKAFSETFPFMCTDQQIRKPDDYKKIHVFPSMVLKDQLYQGRGEQATDQKMVNDLQLTHIVNISCEHKSAFPEQVQYLTLKLDDVPGSQLIQYFNKSTDFLTDAIDNGGRVLVHCNMGVSRSSTITIAYLIKSKGWTLRVAHDFLKERRTCIRPNRGFLQQLSIWEEMILGKKYTDADDLWF